jgi:uncharacterized delta-60 repeat protein
LAAASLRDPRSLPETWIPRSAETGSTVTAFGPDHDVAQAVAVQEDGKVLLGGYADTGPGFDFALAHYLSSGDLDLSFGGDGTVTSSVGDADDRAFGVAIQTDGAMVTVGDSTLHGNHRFALMRHTASGKLDLTFGGDGAEITEFGDGDDGAESVALQRTARSSPPDTRTSGSSWPATWPLNRPQLLGEPADRDGSGSMALS